MTMCGSFTMSAWSWAGTRTGSGSSSTGPFPTLTAARNGLRDFHTQRERQAQGATG